MSIRGFRPPGNRSIFAATMRAARFSFALIALLVSLSLSCTTANAFGQEEKSGPRQAGPRQAGPQRAETPGPASGPYPMEVVDDTGYTVRLNHRPEAIISLTAFTDDVLLDLVDHRRLIGLTSFSGDPAISNVAVKATDIPRKLRMNIEVILSLRPDLVFVANWSEADKVVLLRDAGLPVYLVSSGLTVPAIQEKIRTVGRLVDAVEEAEAMISRMDRRLAAVQDRVSAIPQSERRTVLDYAAWGSAQGAGSSWDEIVRRAGLINAADRFAADEWGQVPLSKEKILELDPDLLILPDWVYGDPRGAGAFYRQTVEDPALRGLTAVREGRVYQMPEGLKAATSQYIVDAVEYLARLAYPELLQS
jgi:iron complex transport system substrate-binding protein